MKTTLLERIEKSNAEVKAIRSELEHMSSYYDVSYADMYKYYHAMKQKSAEKYIEGWVANLLDVAKKDAMSYDKTNDVNGFDLGDLVAGSTLVPGKNNIELKVMFADNSATIGGGQLRFYEPLAGYLFMKAWTNEEVEYFFLTKTELINEITQRATTPQVDKNFKVKTDKNGQPCFYAAFNSSQGSGKITGNNENRLRLLNENLEVKRQDQIGWAFNAKTEPALYKKWQEKYRKTPAELKLIFNKMKELK